MKDSGRGKRRGAVWARIVLAVLLIGIFLVAMRFPGFVRSVPLEFDWDHAKGFRSISVEHPLPLPFYNTLVTVQAGPRISSLLRKSGWRSAKGRLSVRVSLYFFVLGLDREALNTEIIDPETTPLMHAAEDGSITHLERLIAEGADVNAQDQRGWTALMHAAMKDRAKEAEVLLAAGANPNLKDRDGRTAMLWSARSCAPDVAEILAQSGASFNAKDNHGDSPSNYLSLCPGIARVLKVDHPSQREH